MGVGALSVSIGLIRLVAQLCLSNQTLGCGGTIMLQSGDVQKMGWSIKGLALAENLKARFR